MLIKVCGMREPQNIRAVSSLDIDLMGFIFYPQSSRFVPMISSQAGIIPDYSNIVGAWARGNEGARSDFGERGARSEEARSDKRVGRVGVFVDDMPQNIVTRVYNYGLDYVQLHGNESPVMIDNLRRTLSPDIHPGIRIIKALSIGQPSDVEKWRPYRGHADMLLFDTRCSSHGGSGSQFDWSVLQAYDGDIPFLLSGGIGPEDAARVRAFSHPMCAGIDLNSRFETAPAVKDVELLRTFIDEIRQANE